MFWEINCSICLVEAKSDLRVYWFNYGTWLIESQWSMCVESIPGVQQMKHYTGDYWETPVDKGALAACSTHPCHGRGLCLLQGRCWGHWEGHRHCPALCAVISSFSPQGVPLLIANSDTSLHLICKGWSNSHLHTNKGIRMFICEVKLFRCTYLWPCQHPSTDHYLRRKEKQMF